MRDTTANQKIAILICLAPLSLLCNKAYLQVGSVLRILMVLICNQIKSTIPAASNTAVVFTQCSKPLD